jgi:hypothetical protein
MVKALPRDIARVDTIRVQVRAKGKTLQQTAPCAIPVYIPATRKPELGLSCLVIREAINDDTVMVRAALINHGSAAAYDVTVQVQFPGTLQLAPDTQPLTLRIDVLQPGVAVQFFPWQFIVQRGATLDSADICFITEARFVQPQTCCTRVLIPPADVAGFDFQCTLEPDTAWVDATSGEYDEALFSTTLSNPTAIALDSVRCTIILPEGVLLAAGEKDEKIVRNLLPGMPRSLQWRLRVVRDTATVFRQRSIRVDFVGAGTVERCSQTIIIAPPPQLDTDFIISCTAPDTIVYQHSTVAYAPAPFLIRTDITNTGSTTLTNVRGTLTPDARFALESGETLTKSLGVDLAPGQKGTLAWNCRGIPQPETVTAVSGIRVEADGGNARSCDAVTVMLHPPSNDSLSAEIVCLAPDTVRYYGRSLGWRPSPFTFSVRLTNTGTVVLDGLRGTVLLPEGFALEAGESGAKVFPSNITPGETVALNWTVRVLSSGSINPCFEALVNIPGSGTVTCEQCVYVEPPFDNIQLSIPDDNVGMMGQTVDVPIDLLNQLALPMKDFTLAIAYDPQLVSIEEIGQVGTLTRTWPPPTLDHPSPGLLRLRFTGDTPLLTSGVLAFLRCRLLQLEAWDGSFGVFQSRLAFVPPQMLFEPGIAAITIDGQIFTSGSCIVPLDDKNALQLGNSPNPFNPITVISWNIPVSLEGEEGALLVLDMHGRLVARLHEGRLTAGPHQTVFDATMLPSGIYLYRLQAGSKALTRKMMIAK